MKQRQSKDDDYAETQVLDSQKHAVRTGHADADIEALYEEYVREVESLPKPPKSVRR